MTFEPLLSSLTWIFVILVPLALLIVLFDSNTNLAPPHANNPAAHPCGKVDSRSASEAQTPLPEHLQPRHRPPVPLTPIKPPQTTAPSYGRIHVIDAHINQLMANRHVEAVFDDESDFDFSPGDEEEYWSDKEEEIPFSFSSQYSQHHLDRCHDLQDRAAPFLNRDIPVNFVGARERPSAAATAAYPPTPHVHYYNHDAQSRKPPASHNYTSVKEALQLLGEEFTTQASATAAARAAAQIAAAANSKAKQKPALPWRPTPSPMKQRAPYETLNAGTGSDDIADSQYSTRPQSDTSNGPPLLESRDASEPPPNKASNSTSAGNPHNGKSNSSLTGRRSSISTHFDALMRQQRIQHTHWTHADIPFERSAWEHQFQDVECYIRAEGENPGDVDLSEGSEAEAGEAYSYQEASENRALDSPPFTSRIPNPPFTPPMSPAPQPPSHDEYAHACSPGFRSLATASPHYSTIDAAWASELAPSQIEAREIAQRRDNARVGRYPAKPSETEHDQLEAIPLPSTSVVDNDNSANTDATLTKVRHRSEQEAQRGLSASIGPVPTRPVRVPGGMVNVAASKGTVGVSSPMDPEMAVYTYEPVRKCQEQWQQQQELTPETARPELNREAARITSVILPYSNRYDAEHDLLTLSVPLVSESTSAPCRTGSHLQLHEQTQLRKQVHFLRKAPSASTLQPLCAEDPVFGTGTIHAVSPSVARQVEMRAGRVLSLQDGDELSGEQDWSDDEYRYGDVASNNHDDDYDDWTQMPSNR